MFLARGNNEAYPGRQGALVEATCDGLASCGYENLYYSALYTDLSCQTTYDGAIAGHTQMAAYAALCPHSKLILAGYSQGGQIAGDILGGGGGYSFNGCYQPETPPLDRTTSPGNQIAAVIIFGDTRHTANQPYNYGNGSNLNGWFPRPASQLAALEAWTNITRDWCVSTDPICAANQTFSEITTHLGYYNVYSDAAASWLKSIASLTGTSSFSTAVPTSLSGTIQNYATVPTATPSGTVTLDTTWTSTTSITPCTALSYPTPSFTSEPANATELANMSTTTALVPLSASSAVFPITTSSAASGSAGASSSGTAKGSSSSASSGGVSNVSRSTSGIFGALVLIGSAILF
ncbi:hypothetical protein B0A55_04580 [Friedmanniomyces simplex]|uniref:Cutinase n=1 Tax=Friedmanniomyces simplex TaxID=329884 RepID=A0A4U0XJ03_9PEZI|nr:hypothetical protein B0A55_04580 [Friedmanniomyces simplex]